MQKIYLISLTLLSHLVLDEGCIMRERDLIFTKAAQT